MNIIDTLFFSIEIIGTAVFAISGALTAIERRLDLFGVFVLATATSSGGGIIRDLILGNTPPVFFQRPIYIIITVIATAILLFAAWHGKNFIENGKMAAFLFYINIFDALGLGMFSIIGVNASIKAGFGDNMFLSVFVGIVTGIGGGMLRDVLVGRTPVVLRREIYAIAVIIGCIIYYYLRLFAPQTVAMLIGSSVIIIIRIVAIKMKLALPVSKATENLLFKTDKVIK